MYFGLGVVFRIQQKTQRTVQGTPNVRNKANIQSKFCLWLQTPFSPSEESTILDLGIFISISSLSFLTFALIPLQVHTICIAYFRLFASPWTIAHQASLSIINSWSLLKLMSIESVIPSTHLILSSPSPPAFNLSQQQGLFQWVSSLHQVTKVLMFQLQHQSFQWIFRTDLL